MLFIFLLVAACGEQAPSEGDAGSESQNVTQDQSAEKTSKAEKILNEWEPLSAWRGEEPHVYYGKKLAEVGPEALADIAERVGYRDHYSSLWQTKNGLSVLTRAYVQASDAETLIEEADRILKQDAYDAQLKNGVLNTIAALEVDARNLAPTLIQILREGDLAIQGRSLSLLEQMVEDQSITELHDRIYPVARDLAMGQITVRSNTVSEAAIRVMTHTTAPDDQEQLMRNLAQLLDTLIYDDDAARIIADNNFEASALADAVMAKLANEFDELEADPNERVSDTAKHLLIAIRQWGPEVRRVHPQLLELWKQRQTPDLLQAITATAAEKDILPFLKSVESNSKAVKWTAVTSLAANGEYGPFFDLLGVTKDDETSYYRRTALSQFSDMMPHSKAACRAAINWLRGQEDASSGTVSKFAAGLVKAPQQVRSELLPDVIACIKPGAAGSSRSGKIFTDYFVATGEPAIEPVLRLAIDSHRQNSNALHFVWIPIVRKMPLQQEHWHQLINTDEVKALEVAFLCMESWARENSVDSPAFSDQTIPLLHEKILLCQGSEHRHLAIKHFLCQGARVKPFLPQIIALYATPDPKKRSKWSFVDDRAILQHIDKVGQSPYPLIADKIAPLLKQDNILSGDQRTLWGLVELYTNRHPENLMAALEWVQTAEQGPATIIYRSLAGGDALSVGGREPSEQQIQAARALLDVIDSPIGLANKSASVELLLDMKWMGPPILPVLQKYLEADYRDAYKALNEFDRDAEQLLPFFREKLREREYPDRFTIIATIGRIGPSAQSAEPELISVIRNDSSVSVRRKAVWALGMIGSSSPQAVGVVLAYLDGRNSQDQKEVIQALDRMASSSALVSQKVSALLASEDLNVRKLAAKFLSEHGLADASSVQIVKHRILQDLRNGARYNQTYADYALLANLGDPGAEALVEVALEYPSQTDVIASILTGMGLQAYSAVNKHRSRMQTMGGDRELTPDELRAKNRWEILIDDLEKIHETQKAYDAWLKKVTSEGKVSDPDALQ